MSEAKEMVEEQVRPEWVDYNGHMNDAAYAIVFSMAVDNLIERIGLDAGHRHYYNYSIYTLENHICYLREAYEGQAIKVSVQIIDYDAKRLHVFFVMENAEGERLATSEQMLMGIDMESGRPGPFPLAVKEKVESRARADKEKPLPVEAGRSVGIHKKK